LRILLRISIRPQHEEVFVTLAMLHIDRARTRMPLVCSVISLLVLTVFVALGFTSWLLETNDSAPAVQDAKSAPVPELNPSATNVSTAESPDPDATDSWVMHGREF
jgi:hypothetical protein